jgi:Tol biopolymer transport system component
VRAVITDFGLARRSHGGGNTVESVSAGMGFAGTPDYMAPEQIEGGKATTAADIYALGVVMYQMVTGALPFTGDTPFAVGMKKLTEKPPSPRSHFLDLDLKWEAAILRCLERDPADRFASATDVVKVLSGESGRLEGRRLRIGKRWGLGLGLAAVAAVAVVVYAFLVPPPQPRIVNSSPLTRDGRPKGGPILGRGPRIYFVEEGAGLVSLPMARGQVEGTSTPRGLWASDISADGSQFLGVEVQQEEADNPLCTWPASGGQPRRLGDLRGVGGVGEVAAAWSPDRSKIVYTTAEALVVADADGGNPRRLASVPGQPVWPRWSPRGDVVRFGVYDRKAEVQSLWEVAASGANLHELLPGWRTQPHECCGTWTADGRYYVFESTQNGRNDIWALPEGPSLLHWRRPEPVRVTAGPNSYYAPQPGKDSKKLFVIGDQSSLSLQRYDRGAGAFKPYLPGVPAHQVGFSRDGNWMAFTSYPEHTLWRSRLDGTERRPLTDPAKVSAEGTPYWSPDGKRIAFMGKLPDGHYKVCLVSPDGGEISQPVPGDGDQGIPTWSRDGKQIVFGERLQRRDTSAMTIHLFNFESRELSTLPGSGGLWTPRWSPDGKYIAALRAGVSTSAAFSSELRLFEWATHKWVLLAKIGRINEPTWSGDSRYIYLDLDTLDPDPALYRVRVPDGNPERLASLKDIPRAGEVWSGVAPDGSPLISRSEVFQEIYALDVEWR